MDLVRKLFTSEESKDLDEETKDVRDVNIQDLPQEILLHIFSFFGHKERIRTITPVCRHWRSISRDSAFHRELILDGDDSCVGSTADVVHLLKMASNHLKTLHVVRRHDMDAILLQVNKSNRKLQNLVIRNCRGERTDANISAKLIRRVLKNCKELQCVRITDSGCLYRVFKGKMQSGSLPHLRALELGYGPHYLTRVLNLAVYGVGLHQTEEFFANFTSKDEELRSLADACSDNLEEFQMNGVLWTDRAIDYLLKFQKMRVLRIRFGGHLTCESIVKLSQFPILDVLDVSLVDNVSSDTWATLVSHPNLQNLSQLCLSLNWQVNDSVLEKISTNCCRLQKISLAGNPDISTTGLTCVITRCRQLTHINLYFTPRGLAECFYLIPVHLPGLKELVVGPMMRRDLFQKSLDRLKKQLTGLKILMHPE